MALLQTTGHRLVTHSHHSCCLIFVAAKIFTLHIVPLLVQPVRVTSYTHQTSICPACTECICYAVPSDFNALCCHVCSSPSSHAACVTEVTVTSQKEIQQALQLITRSDAAGNKSATLCMQAHPMATGAVSSPC